MNSILISPHDDDSTLFASFISIREHPIVVLVTDSYIQPDRGDIGCSAFERAKETENACKILGCPVIRLGIRDDSVTEEAIFQELKRFVGFDIVYAPAIQGGNRCHDIVGKVAKDIWPDCKRYTTYTKTELWTKGNIEIIPTKEEIELKRKALMCYQSQINLPATRPHFIAVLEGVSEWLI